MSMFEMIMQGMTDALEYLKGDKSRAREVTVTLEDASQPACETSIRIE